MTSLSVGDYLAFAGLLAAFVALPGGMIGMALRSLKGQMAKIDERLMDVEQNKVSHAEWVRVAASQNNRMNRVSEQLSELSGKMDATFGIPRGLGRIAAALEGRQEQKS